MSLVVGDINYAWVHFSFYEYVYRSAATAVEVMEGKERQPVQGGGHVILEVTNPRELKKQEQYKRGDVVSLQHSYPVSQT